MKISINNFNESFFQQKKLPGQNPVDKMISILNKQKNRLQEEMKKINSNKDDDMTKKSKKEKLQSQIEAIEQQIAALQLEKLKQGSDAPKEMLTGLDSDDTQDGSGQPVGVPLAESKHFMTALNKNDTLKTMKKVHTNMLGKAHAAMAQVSVNGASAAERYAILAPVREFEAKMNTKANEIQDELKKASEEISQKRKHKKEEQKAREEKEIAQKTEEAKNDNPTPASNKVSPAGTQAAASVENANSADLQPKQHQNQELSQYRKFSPETEKKIKEKLDFQV